MKTIQFEPFPDCQQACSFCYCTGIRTPDETKINSWKKILEFLNSDEMDNYEIVSIIGGEYLQDIYSDEVTKHLEVVLDKLFEMYSTAKIKGIWLNATITKPFNDLTIKYLEKFNTITPPDKRTGFFICTSWDFKGRFHREEQQRQWETNMKLLSEKYPNVNKSVAIIMTQPFLEHYLDTNMSLIEFGNEYGASIFFKQTCEVLKEGYSAKPKKDAEYIDKKEFNKKCGFDFYPKRETMLQFMYRLASRESHLLTALFSISKRATDLISYWEFQEDGYIEHRYLNEEIEISGDVMLNSCGHTISYRSYQDSDACIRCDRDAVYFDVTGHKFEDRED